MTSDIYSVYEESVKFVFKLMEAEKRIEQQESYIAELSELAGQLQDAIAERDKPCVWREQEDGAYWDTTCQNAICFFDAGPVENKYQFCPFCGHRIEVAP